ncbi:MAG TPA: PRC-barrel domain-containing protein [Solirubrobacteraceae bacterium]
MDIGPPISYEVLASGTKVLSSDGKDVGTVVHVLADEGEDVFDGIVIAPSGASGHRFADADDIAEIHEGAVLLKLSGDDSAQLPEPTANPVVMHEDPAEGPSRRLPDKLRRAWDLLSGNY